MKKNVKYATLFFIVALFSCSCNKNTIFDYIETDNVAGINNYISENKEINLSNEEGLTPLMFAIKLHKNEIAKNLIKGGANINDLTKKGLTPLIVAIRYKNKDFISFLLTQDVDINSKLREHPDALAVAVYYGDLDTVKSLLGKKANMNAFYNIKDKQNRKFYGTPLFIAIERNHLQIAELLIDKGADINLRSKALINKPISFVTKLMKIFGSYLIKDQLLWNTINHYEEINTVENIVEENEFFTLNRGSSIEISPLQLAIIAGYDDIALKLIKSGANVNEDTYDGGTPLIFAIQNNKENITKELISAGADVNKKAMGEITPLMVASQIGNIDIIKELINQKANVNEQTRDGRTALSLAVAHNRLDIVKILLKEHAGVNIKVTNVPLLLYAIQEKNYEISEELIKNNADIDAVSAEGLTPLLVAIRNNDEKMINLLIRYHVDLNHITKEIGYPPILFAFMVGHALGLKNNQIINAMLDAGVDINLQDRKHGVTLLMLASEKGDVSLVKKLIALQADVNIQARKQFTALFVAIDNGHEEVVRELIHANADVNASFKKYGFTYTPLMYANKRENKEIIDMLIAAGAK